MSKQRRGAGEGTITKRADGRWTAAISIGVDEKGKRRRRWIYGKTRAEVAGKLAALQVAAVQGRIADPKNETVATLAKRWLEGREDRPRTDELYEGRLRLHVLPILGHVKLSQLKPIHISDWLAGMKAAEVGATTRRGCADLLNRVLEMGVGLGLLEDNPGGRLERPKVPMSEVQALSAEEAQALLETAQASSPPWMVAVVALGLCGLRRGEVFGLAWQHVEADRVRIRQALSELKSGERLLGEPKTRSARREVPLTSQAIEALRVHRQSMGVVPHPARLVFATRAGKPIQTSGWYRHQWRPLVNRASLEGTTFHMLRHTCATLALGEGADVVSVSAILGHARASITLDRYSHVIPKRVDDAVAKLSQALGG